MGILFDVRTMFLVGACTSLLACVTLLALQRLYRPAQTALRLYGAAAAAIAVGQALLALRDAVPAWIAYSVTNILLCWGMLLFLEATRRLFGQSPPRWQLIAPLAAVVPLWAWLGADLDDLRTRIVVMSVLLFGGSLLSAIVVFRSADFGHQRCVRTLCGFFALFALIHPLRAFAVFNDPLVLTEGALAASLTQAGFVLVFSLSPVALSLVIQMLLHARISRELHRRATTDEVTGLLSRGYLFDRIRERLEEPESGTEVRHLLMIDIDRFKTINDRFGHQNGDRALQHVAGVLRDGLDGRGILGRYGGEEFCALLLSKDPADAFARVEHLRRRLESTPLFIDGQPVTLTASFGIVPISGPASFERALQVADQGVYRAKTQGRNRVALPDSIAIPIV